MSRGRRQLNFRSNPEWMQQWMLENTWCDQCGKADLGMSNPEQYEEAGKVFVAGSCAQCGERVVSEVIDADAG